jgi:hypothetical protein
MQDRPTAAELLHAVRAFLEEDLEPHLEGRRRFHTRVAANLLGILEREWEHEETDMRAEWTRLVGLLSPADTEPPPTAAALRDAVHGMNATLAERIRAGAFDDRWDEVLAAVAETVGEKLRTANPAYAEDPAGSSGAGS